MIYVYVVAQTLRGEAGTELIRIGIEPLDVSVGQSEEAARVRGLTGKSLPCILGYTIYPSIRR